MRRVIALMATVLLVGLLAAPSSAGHHHPHRPGWRQDHCRFQTVEPGYSTETEVHLWIKCALAHFPASGGWDRANYVSQRESGDSWWATNPTSGTCGIFQHMPRYWPGRLAEFNHAHPYWRLPATDRKGGGGCYNARSNIVVSIWMAWRGGWGPWGF